MSNIKSNRAMIGGPLLTPAFQSLLCIAGCIPWLCEEQSRRNSFRSRKAVYIIWRKHLWCALNALQTHLASKSTSHCASMIFRSKFLQLALLSYAAGGQESRDASADFPTNFPAFVIQLDQKFFAELSHMAASYTDLFSQNGRPKLVQVILKNLTDFLGRKGLLLTFYRGLKPRIIFNSLIFGHSSQRKLQFWCRANKLNSAELCVGCSELVCSLPPHFAENGTSDLHTSNQAVCSPVFKSFGKGFG